MRAKVVEQAEARRLRAEGMSVKRIAKQLSVAVSSVSVWVRDVELPSIETEPAVLKLSGESKRCGRCERDRPIESFNRGQWWCRDCFREYFRARGQRHRDQSGRAKANGLLRHR